LIVIGAFDYGPSRAAVYGIDAARRPSPASLQRAARLPKIAAAASHDAQFAGVSMMRRRTSSACRIVAFTLFTVMAAPSFAQAPPPTPGMNPVTARTPAEAAPLPATPVVSAVASVSDEIRRPGAMFPALFSLPPGEDFDDYGYTAREYFVTGTADGRPYKTRIVVRRPTDAARFSGLVFAESMHPSGNAWMFHFTHRYTMDAGHIEVEIVTSSLPLLVNDNAARYRDLVVEPSQANEIIAQVGALLKSDRPDNPLAGLPLRKLVLAGTSASARVVINYLPAHKVYRLADGQPIYDGFLPTSNASDIEPVDVPLIHVPTMTEVSGGTSVLRQDGDAPGDQYRVYELAGIAHLDARDVEAFRPNPCQYPISLHPIGTGFALALDHLLSWVDTGVAPPRAERILIDRDLSNDGSMMWLDGHGNVQGGVPSPYVDVPVARYAVRNQGAEPYPEKLHPWADRGADGIQALCRLAGYQEPFPAATLRTLYRNKTDYRRQMELRVDELIREGWFLPVYRDVVLADVAKVEF
jgi:hypothetical protein